MNQWFLKFHSLFSDSIRRECVTRAALPPVMIWEESEI